MEPLNARVNVRLPQRIKDDLATLARRRKVDESELARVFLDEALRREKYPGVVFRATPVGREAAIEGRRLCVWQVMETVRAADGDIEEAARFLGLRPDQVRAAADYSAEYRDEIESLIALNEQESEQRRSQWERRHEVLRR